MALSFPDYKEFLSLNCGLDKTLALNILLNFNTSGFTSQEKA